MKLGVNDIVNFRAGDTQVQKLYLGNTLVWPPPFDGDLTAVFKTALYSDKENNLTRSNPITILEHNTTSKFIKIPHNIFPDPLGLSGIRGTSGTGGQSWFICQGTEASILVDVVSVEIVDEGLNQRLYYGTTYLGTPDFSVGQKVEIFNPFINYAYIDDRVQLFDPYPTSTTAEGFFNYIQAGGIFQKSNGTYVLMCPVIFGNHVSRSLYYATSTDLENWTFQDDLIIRNEDITWAQQPGNLFTSGNPIKMASGNYLFLMGVQRASDGNYTDAYMVVDEDLNIITAPTEISINSSSYNFTNKFPLGITYYNGQYRYMTHNRANNVDINKEVWEFVWTSAEGDSHLLNFLNGTTTPPTATKIQDAGDDDGYLHGKMDDAAYFQPGDGNLYMFKGAEQEITTGWVTSNNREYGLALLSGGVWEDDVRSPLIINPVQLQNKYPQYSGAWDHLGGWISPVIKGPYLYLFLTSGGNGPDYYICGMKINLNQ